jgi:ribonuclease Y
MDWIKSYGMALIFLAVGVLVGYAVRTVLGKMNRHSSERKAEKILEDAQHEADTKRKEARLEAKEEVYKVKAELEKEVQSRREDCVQIEKRLMQREENLEKRSDLVDKNDQDTRQREKLFKTKEEELIQKEKELETVLEKERVQLQQLSGLSREEAKKLLISKVESDIQQDAAYFMRQAETRAREEVNRKTQWLIAESMQRCVFDHVKEATVTTVSLPNDEIKGKIIGRDGRNIRTLEAATGVDVIIDDTPETVVLSGFDMVRREIARISLEQLIRDGRIHPARIEEVVEKVKKEMDESVRQAGEQAVFELGVGPMHPELMKWLGRLKYRTSYGQNVLAHSKEVAWLFGALAVEMGLDVKLAKRAGLLHDIGKALSHEVEGSHALIGADLAKKYNEPREVLEGIAGHHEELEEKTLWGVLTQVADAISAGRPGARSDTVENYLQRLEKLEAIASGFKGVERCFAIQAGREIRVLVNALEVNDDAALMMSKDIAKKIQDELQFPGVVKVTVIREMRAVEYAR